MNILFENNFDTLTPQEIESNETRDGIKLDDPQGFISDLEAQGWKRHPGSTDKLVFLIKPNLPFYRLINLENGYLYINTIVDDEDEEDDERFEFIHSKSVPDSDGFYTDYTWYYDRVEDMHVFVFGDTDIYRPEDGNYDWECESEAEAQEWFDNYHGFEDDDSPEWHDTCDQEQVDQPDYMPDTIDEGKQPEPRKKESARVRELIDIIDYPEGLAKKNGYKLYPDRLDIVNGGQFKLTKAQYNRLKELGYGNDSLTESASAPKVTGKTWNEFITNIEAQTNYDVDSAYRRYPDKWIELIDKNTGKIYDAECTKYFDGTYELMTYNITPSYQTESLKEDADWDEDYYFNKIKEVSEPLTDALETFEGDLSKFYFTWNFGIDEDKYITGGLDLRMHPNFKNNKEVIADVMSKTEDLINQYGFKLDPKFKINPGKGIFGSYHYQIIEAVKSINESLNEGLEKYFWQLYCDDYNWNKHDCDYRQFEDELRSYLKPGESVDARDEEGYPLESNIHLKTLFSRMPKDKQIDFIDRFDRTDESLNEAYGTDYSNIPLVDRINFTNQAKWHPCITPFKGFIDALNAVGKDYFKVRSTKFGTNLSQGDIKDSWMDIRRAGWSVSLAFDSSLSGFNEVYICKKLLNEDTIKTKDGKWTNKGDEGTHGKFKTKKEADAQRRAMFANGYHESLKESINNADFLVPILCYLDDRFDKSKEIDQVEVSVNDLYLNRNRNYIDKLLDNAIRDEDRFDGQYYGDESLEGIIRRIAYRKWYNEKPRHLEDYGVSEDGGFDTGRVIILNKDLIPSRVNKLSRFLGKKLISSNESLKESSSSLRKEIYDMLDELGGYTDYQGRIEAVAETFDLSEDEAEGYVCDWIQEPRYDFDESLKESSDMVTVGIYGDEVDGFRNVDALVKFFTNKGIKVSDVDGDMEYGWEMNLTGNPRTLFFAVCPTIPGYNCSSVNEFISQYAIDDLDEELKESRYSDNATKEQKEKGWWYFTTHGVQPGSIPKDLNVLEIKDTSNGSYVRLDGILNTSELKEFDMKEEKPTNESLKEGGYLGYTSYGNPVWHDDNELDSYYQLNDLEDKPIEVGDKFKNKNGIIIEIDSISKDGKLQYKILSKDGSIRDSRSGDPSSVKNMLQKNGYWQFESLKESVQDDFDSVYADFTKLPITYGQLKQYVDNFYKKKFGNKYMTNSFIQIPLRTTGVDEVNRRYYDIRVDGFLKDLKAADSKPYKVFMDLPVRVWEDGSIEDSRNPLPPVENVDVDESLKEDLDDNLTKLLNHYFRHHLAGNQIWADVDGVENIGDDTYKVDVRFTEEFVYEVHDEDGVPYKDFEDTETYHTYTVKLHNRKVISVTRSFDESAKRNSMKEDIPVVSGSKTRFTFDIDLINYNDFLANNFDGWSDDIDYLIKDLNKCAKALGTHANKLMFYMDYDEDFYIIDDIATVQKYIGEDYSLYELSGTGVKFIVCTNSGASYWIFKNEVEATRVINSVKSYASSLNENFKLEGLVDIHDDFERARENWNKLNLSISFDDALEQWNQKSDKAEAIHWYAKPLYSVDAWEDMVKMFTEQPEDIKKDEE